MKNPVRAAGLLLPLLLLLAGCDRLEPPVQVAERESVVGQGMVFEVRNTSDTVLRELRVRIEAPSGEVREYFTPALAAKESVNVGWLKLEGWPIPAGSEVTVKAKGYPLASGPWE
jgi:hypothetical protein